MEKSCRKYAPKASARPFYNFVNNPKQPEIILKVRYFERGLSKSLTKGKFIFSFAPSPF